MKIEAQSRTFASIALASTMLALGLALITAAGCTKPAPIPNNEATSTTTVQGEESTDATVLEARYGGESEQAARIDTINAFSGAEPSAAIAALGRLLGKERNPELRSIMIDTVASFEEHSTAQVAIIGPIAVDKGESEEAREAALSALELIDDSAAISYWERLLKSDDDAVRDLARHRIEELRDAGR